MKKWFYEVVARFREKGAVSPEKAMTIEELGLPPQFETAMNKHLDQSGVFVEINGKYYFSEEKLKQIWKPGSAGSVLDSKRKILMLRTVQPIVIFFFWFCLSKFSYSEFGIESDFNSSADCLARDICLSNLLFVKAQKENVFQNRSTSIISEIRFARNY